MKIRICIPFYHEICAETVIGVRDCMKQKSIAWEVASTQGPYIGQSRNHLVNRGKSRHAFQDPDPDVDFFLFVDADIGFQFRHVAQLLEDNCSIASGAYLRQRDGRNLTAGRWLYKYGRKVPGLVDGEGCLTSGSPKGITPVDYAGGGFLLVKGSVFQLLPYPWFRERVIEVYDPAFPKDDKAEYYQIGEDLGFCTLAGEEEIPIVCDTRVTLFHKPRPRVDAAKFWAKP